MIYTEYKNDKRANEISGSDRHQECKWFDQLDIWNSTCACLKNQIPASATEGEDDNDEDKSPSDLQNRNVIPKQEKKKKNYKTIWNFFWIRLSRIPLAFSQPFRKVQLY